MREANEERKRNLDLQKAQYNLQKMLSQRTILQYSEEKGMHYVADTSGIRDAKQAVDDAQLEIDIAAKEKEISLIEDEIKLLEKQKDAIQDQIDALDKQAESIEKYYDKLIKEQEKMFDSMIKNLENQKSKWEELAEIQEIAEAYAAVKQAADDLGYSVEDLLNGNEAAFEDFKSRYIAIMSDCGQNTAFQDGLEYASGVAKENFGSIVEMSGDVKNALTDIGSAASTDLEPVATAMEKIGTSSSTASTNTSKIADDMSTLNTNTTGLSDNLTGISDALSGMPEAEKFDAIATAFTNLGEAIKGVATALGVGEEGTVGGLVGALQTISTLSLDGISAGSANGSQVQGSGKGNTGGGIISQFNALKDAVDAVTSAIGGGGGSTGASDDASTSSSPSMSAGATDGNAGGLTGALDSLKQKASDVIGSPSGEDGKTDTKNSDGDETVIGSFEGLKSAVDNVSSAIGSGEEENDDKKSDASTLTDAITGLGETTKTIIGSPEEEETVTGRFKKMSDVLGDANKHVTGISDGLTAIDGQEVECTIKVNIETTGGLPVGIAKSTGTALDTMNLESAEYNAKYGKAHAEGTALVSGNWAVQSDEKKALLGELGYEIIVRNGRFFTVGENGAEMFPIKKGDIVFNHEQSVQLLKNGHISGRGKAYANGTVNDGTIVTSNGTVLRPLQPGDKDYELLKKFEAYHEQFRTQIIPPVNAINKNTELITKSINNVNNRSTQQQISFSTGDIIVQGVQNVDGFAKAVKTHFPNAMLQAIHKR